MIQTFSKLNFAFEISIFQNDRTKGSSMMIKSYQSHMHASTSQDPIHMLLVVILSVVEFCDLCEFLLMLS
jgi:hypothetical protein